MRVILIPVVLLVLFSACLLPAHTHAETIRCESRNGELKECGSNISAARLIQQITDWPCDHGRTWGVRNGHVWVSNFCRGIFEIQRIQERFRLTVSHAGQGFGSIETNPSGIDYPINAEALFPGGSAVSVQATPEAGSVFSGWSGDCSGRGDCLVSMVENRSVIAHFNRSTLLPWLSLIVGNDRVNPLVTITLPTASPIHTTDRSPLRIGGTAAETVTQLTWANDRGGSGICTGTTTWSASGIVLDDSNPNLITVTARDAEGNSSTDTVTVSYEPPSVPAVMITSPTANPMYTTDSSPLSIGGTASDTVTQLTWTNDRGGSGICTGTTTWSASGIVLDDSSPNLITVTARDVVGNTSADTVTVSYEPPGQDCDFPNLPDPVLNLIDRQTQIFGSFFIVYYTLAVANSAEYPGEMFVLDPVYPICGETTGSRMSVEIYDSEDSLITEHCDLSSPDELGSLLFSIFNDSSYPSAVYIRMVDRECENVYLSNSVITND